MPIQSNGTDVYMDWLPQYLNTNNRLPHPNWELVYKHIDEHLSHLESDTFWVEVARQWLSKLSAALEGDYKNVESENFILLSAEGASYTSTFLKFLEHSRAQLLKALNGITSDHGYGKHVVIIVSDNDTYYDYISNYGPEAGTYGLSSGMYINYGYGHFIFPHQEIDQAMPIAAHEMTHALLTHLPIPTWLNEGLAMNMERLICNIPSPRLNRAMFEQHEEFWQETRIQEFWHGGSFSRPDVGQELSYHLAQILVNNLAENYDSFVSFANKANWQDGGENAIKEVFDISLGDMIYNFIGDGEWSPQPGTWQESSILDNS